MPPERLPALVKHPASCAHLFHLRRGESFALNVPPWDTRVCYVVEHAERHRSYLIGWVPPQLVAVADAGIDVNPEVCILWAADLDAAFTRWLRQAGVSL